jgi:hypothetical protein
MTQAEALSMLERLAAVINADMDLNVSPEMRRQVALRVLQVDSFDDVDATARRIVELLWSERTLH